MGILINKELEAFTLGPLSKKISTHVFEELQKQGTIFKSKRLINWDENFQTSLADIEVETKNEKKNLYFIKYIVKKTKEVSKEHIDYLLVATTRPETIFADSALLVSPEIIQHQKMLKFTYLNPLTKKELKIYPLKEVDPEFGTGITKCTPGHSPFD